MTYNQFKASNDMSKHMGSTVGRITKVDCDWCELTVMDNVSRILISQLVNEIVYDGMGCVSNPSALRKWKGFDK